MESRYTHAVISSWRDESRASANTTGRFPSQHASDRAACRSLAARAAPDSLESGKRLVIRVGQRMQVALGGSHLRVPDPGHDRTEVGTAG